MSNSYTQCTFKPFSFISLMYGFNMRGYISHYFKKVQQVEDYTHNMVPDEMHHHANMSAGRKVANPAWKRELRSFPQTALCKLCSYRLVYKVKGPHTLTEETK